MHGVVMVAHTHTGVTIMTWIMLCGKIQLIADMTYQYEDIKLSVSIANFAKLFTG